MLMLSPLAPLGILPPNIPGTGVRTTLPGVRGVRGLVPRRLAGSVAGRPCD